MVEPKKKKAPTPEEFFLQNGLYSPFALSSDSEEHAQCVLQIEFYDGSLKCHCLGCKSDTVFRTDRIQGGELNPYHEPHKVKLRDFRTASSYTTLAGVYQMPSAAGQYAFVDHFFRVEFYCTRDFSHRLAFFGAVQRLVLSKIGQYPSYSDLTSPDVSRYRKVLGEQGSREYTRAVRLYSHDLGIASYVYLRRIVEGLIEEAHQAARLVGAWDEEAWARSRTAERIKMLAGHLPEFLQDNPAIYGILSKGVHELDEEQCLSYFPVLRAGIDLALEDKLAKLEKDAKRKELATTLGAIPGALKKTGAS